MILLQDIKAIVAQNMIALRRKKGYTQAELAELLNYTDKAVSKWERGESIPDVTVLKQIADLFEVTVDYLITPEEQHQPIEREHVSRRRRNNRRFIMGMSIALVWLIATFAFVLITLLKQAIGAQWIVFVYAVPISMIVWLTFNSIWFNRRRNFLIISLLMWSLLGSIYITLLPLNTWLLFALGVPGQIIILFWSRLKRTFIK